MGLADRIKVILSRGTGKALGVLVLLSVAGFVHATEGASGGLFEGPSTPGRPNFLFIVADDLGYSDISRLGGEIPTPNIDSIANNGVLFTRFYASSMCAPTRAMLLTGVDHHRTGLGNMPDFRTDNQKGRPGYEGYLNRRVLTAAELLLGAGYHTYMAGKWHLGYGSAQGARARGFERSFSLEDGAASHFADMMGATALHPNARYFEDGELVSALPDDFYSSRFFTDRLIAFIDENLADKKPFFAYAAYTAPHWPLHAPDDILDKYAGKYDEGYDIVRLARYRSMQKLGLVPDTAAYPARPAHVPAWSELSAGQQSRAARRMEIYAVMIDDLDSNIGRLLDFLRSRGELDNTVIVFLSDNGADGFSLQRAPAHIAEHANLFDNSFENIGKVNSFEFIGPEWANVAEASFRLYKTMPTEGGVRVPAAIWAPLLGGSTDTVNHHPTSVMDIVPTVLELAGVEHPGERAGSTVFPPDGRSLVPVLNNTASSVRDDAEVIGFELAGRRALIQGQWKILFIPLPAGNGRWELFNLELDPGEQHDLADTMTEKVAEMVAQWEAYAEDTQLILPLTGELRSRPVENADARQ